MRRKRQRDDDVRETASGESERLNRNPRSERADGCVPIADGSQRQVGEFLDALANQRCRYVIRYNKKEVGLEEVADQVAAQEHGIPAEELDERVRKNVLIDLYHVQLPKLDEAGLITFDHQNELIRYRTPEPVERFLDDWTSVERSESSEE